MVDRRKDRPHLLLPGDGSPVEPGDPFADLENARYRPQPEVEAAQPKLERRPGRLFAQIELHWLTELPLRRFMPPELRLYLVVQIRSRRGSRTVRLTNAMATEAGLDRFQKSKCLRHLEEAGLLKVVRTRNRNPDVAWLPPSATMP